ncbi:bifunctional phosphoribosylaminoimidazolecarboxamide formyltransferase/IMP cyclohydrolase [Methanoplanus sp. FWC-SCC4]|uniref:Bifunctional phosphoribosylaminoimidazolecarboxamide formyltransferase/IMP cyclohydrolase n=1 Tax=Methanochimaera problematica TaxID=2609417 RepID=A0AA97FEI5_9EURY|nr:bifunctional phosphoribosylaminoimidazolecarboxamide formyltransferase/IMP cyclohydrolase [Methanoplanus sp. FWC-SCC4]WOF16583.1 bifunctional phosphoribosylaminoimidazolecarboxamide formyltransferase/IMP cyclohydrolase [Methanoplanus sp. FWC-SCC4]
MKYALLSVWDKTGIIELAQTLKAANFKILSSGGTAKTLREAGLDITEVSDYTGAPEMMDGRVKTLHPKIHGGLLGRRGIDDAVMEEHGISGIDLLVVNLYPFEEMSGKDLPLNELVEYIDIGGPAMIRAAAKNFKDVAVVIDPKDYDMVKEAVRGEGFTEKDRLYLAKKVFARTASYDAAIANYFYSIDSEFPEVYTVQFRNGRTLRYGENPHQKAAVYGETGIAGQTTLQGKEMSYNNYLDVDAAVSLLREFEETASVIVKHNNPCGVATGEKLLDAYLSARDVDPVSAYGGIVALNREVGADVAEELASTFIEVVIAPSYTDEALKIMTRKENMRVLVLPEEEPEVSVRTIDGGALLQKTPKDLTENWQVVTEREPTAEEMESMKLAMKVCKHTKSNAIIFAKGKSVLGIGAGQMNRVNSAQIAVMKSNFPLEGSAVASDAFLPFADTLEEAAKAGATALLQPGGSIRDQEVIDAANRLNVAMVFTGIRYFRH